MLPPETKLVWSQNQSGWCVTASPDSPSLVVDSWSLSLTFPPLLIYTHAHTPTVWSSALKNQTATPCFQWEMKWRRDNLRLFCLLRGSADSHAALTSCNCRTRFRGFLGAAFINPDQDSKSKPRSLSVKVSASFFFYFLFFSLGPLPSNSLPPSHLIKLLSIEIMHTLWNKSVNTTCSNSSLRVNPCISGHSWK